MITPIKGNVLVKPLMADYESVGGIIVPDSFKEESNKVEIIAVGNGTKQRPMYLKKGDIGFRVKDWGTEVIHNGELHYIMDMNDILAVE